MKLLLDIWPMNFRFAALFALGLAACSPPLPSADEQQERVPISAAARSEMDRVNSETSVALRTRPDGEDSLGSGALSESSTTTDKEHAAASERAEAEKLGVPESGPPMAASVDSSIKYDAGLVRIQVLLDRAHFSPGVIDGYDGDNVRKAVSAYQKLHGKPVDGKANEALLQELAAADSAPALVSYTIEPDDVRGPFLEGPAGDLEAMSKLDHLGYASAAEAIAEKFHMDQDLLRLLNPGADFAKPGTDIVVADAGGELNAKVALIEVDKGAAVVRAYDASNKLLAFYPATIGSSEAPAPSGDFSVVGVAFDPTYRYDPKRLPTFGERDHGALTIASGPNNPVGAVWIALSKETYGIHGTAEPAKISKTASHGCVRLTNWDAIELGHAVAAGVPVRFVEGSSKPKGSKARGAG